MAEKRKKSGNSGSAVNSEAMKAFTHELRVRILGVLSERTASPKELADELGEPLGNVSYHVKILKDLDCIELVKMTPRRGAMEHYYRIRPGSFIADRNWAQLLSAIRPN